MCCPPRRYSIDGTRRYPVVLEVPGVAVNKGASRSFEVTKKRLRARVCRSGEARRDTVTELHRSHRSHEAHRDGPLNGLPAAVGKRPEPQPYGSASWNREIGRNSPHGHRAYGRWRQKRCPGLKVSRQAGISASSQRVAWTNRVSTVVGARSGIDGVPTGAILAVLDMSYACVGQLDRLPNVNTR